MGKSRFLFFSVCILSLLTAQSLAQTLSVQATPNYVGQEAAYNFLVSGLSSIPAVGQSLYIAFPSQYNISLLNAVLVPSLGVQGATLSLPRANIFQISGTFTDINVELYLWTIQNPSQNLTNIFQVFLVTNGVPQFLASSNLTLQPAFITSASLTPSNPTTYAVNNLTLTFTPINGLPIGSQIVLNLPKLNPQAPSNLQRSMLQSSSVGCIGLTGIETQTTCTFMNNQLIITNGYKETANTNNQPVSVVIFQFKNPYSTAAQTGFSLLTRINSSCYIDQADGMSMKVSYPNTPYSVYIYTSNPTIMESCNISVQIVPESFLYAGSSLQITFPEDFDMSNTESIQIYGIYNVQQGLITQYTQNGNTFTLNNVVVSSYLQNVALRVTFTNVTNYNYVGRSNSFEVLLLDVNGNYIEQQTSNIYYTTQPGALTNVQITMLSSTTVSSVSSYQISFNTANTLDAKSTVVVTFPPEIILATRSIGGCYKVFNGLSPVSQCQVENNTLTISNCFTDGLVAGSQVSFAIDQVTNAASTAPSSSFTIQTFLEGQLLDYSGNITVQASAGVITILPLESTSMMTGVKSNLTISFQTMSPLPPGSSFTIVFPQGDYNMAYRSYLQQPTCLFTSSFTNSSSCQFFAQTLTVNSGGTSFPALTTFSLVVLGLENPRSVNPISPLLITSYFNSQGIVDQSQTMPVFGMTNASQLISTSVKAQSLIVSALGQYQFSVQFNNRMYSGDQLIINFPQSIVIGNTSACIFYSGYYVASCQLQNSSTLLITMAANLTRQQSIKFAVTQITNSAFSQIALPFQYNVYSGQDGYLIENYIDDSTGVGLFVPAQLRSIQITVNSTVIGELASYTINAQNIFDVQENSVIMIVFPPNLLVYDNVTCQFQSSLTNPITSCLYVNSTAVQITSVPATPANTQLTVIVNSVQNPPSKVIPSGLYFNFEILNSQLQAQQYQQMWQGFAYTCDNNCADCYSSSNFCTACSPSMYLFNNQCVESCPQSYSVLNSGSSKQCIQCLTQPECKYCDPTQPDQCLVCESGKIPSNDSCIPLVLTVGQAEEILRLYGPQVLGVTENVLPDNSPWFFWLISNGNLRDYIYVTVFTVFVMGNLLIRTYLNPELRFRNAFLAYLSLIEPLCSVAACIYFFVHQNFLHASLSVVYVFFLAFVQALTSVQLRPALNDDTHLVVMKGTFRTVKFYLDLSLYYSFRFFYIFFSRMSTSGNEIIYDFRFSFRNEIIKALYTATKLQLIAQTFQVAQLAAYWIQLGDNFSEEILRPVFLLDYPIFTYLVYILNFAQLLQLRRELSVDDNPMRVHPAEGNELAARNNAGVRNLQGEVVAEEEADARARGDDNYPNTVRPYTLTSTTNILSKRVTGIQQQRQQRLQEEGDNRLTNSQFSSVNSSQMQIMQSRSFVEKVAQRADQVRSNAPSITGVVVAVNTNESENVQNRLPAEHLLMQQSLHDEPASPITISQQGQILRSSQNPLEVSLQQGLIAPQHQRRTMRNVQNLRQAEEQL